MGSVSLAVHTMNNDTPRIHIPALPDSDDRETVSLGSVPDAAESAHEDLFNLYDVRDKIGDGGMGVVYLARDRKLGRFVAIKRLNPRAQAISQLRRRFLHEARAVAALNHAHIVHVYALGEDDNGPYIVMEYVAGPGRATRGGQHEPGHPTPPFSLEQRVSRQGQLGVSEAAQLVIKIGQAIAYAHDNGVIHRDIKPSNVLLDASGEPKIVDFGLARLMRDEESKLTVSGEKLLSLGYGAPEQERDAGTSDERADVYGLGALLYFAITGQNPRYFRDSDIPTPLREVLSKALATDREKRWPRARDFTVALSGLLTQTQTEPQPTVKTTWRCKWCDTVNPLTLRYCGECGWDGGEYCAECGQPTFFGVQYCGECGADARAYEAMRLVSSRMERCMGKREFEQVLSFAGRTLGFEPAGDTGRNLLKHMQALREQAERAIARRDQVRESVQEEWRVENYERVRALIAEYRQLRPDGAGFEAELERLPEHQAQRDLARVRAAFRNRDWGTAVHLCQALIAREAPGYDRARDLLRRIRRRCSRDQIARWLLALLLFSFLYLLMPIPLVRLAPAAFRPGHLIRRLLKPAMHLYEERPVVPLLASYARLWGIADPREAFAAAAGAFGSLPVLVGAEAETVSVAPELQPLAASYQAEVDAVEQAFRERESAWPQAYVRELTVLLEQRRQAGDFEGWSDINDELHRFADEAVIGPSHSDEHPELSTLKASFRTMLERHHVERYRALSTASKAYVNALLALQRDYTRAGQMEAAARVNARIRQVRNDPVVIEAEAQLQSRGEALDPAAPPSLDLSEAEHSAELERIRRDYEAALVEIDAVYARRLEQWPQQYLDALEAHMEACRQDGDFEGWERANRERLRFALERRLTEADRVTDLPVLAGLQHRLQQVKQQLANERAGDIVAETDRTLEQLTRRLSDQTKAGDMQAAARINAEIRRVRNSAAYLAAKARLLPAETEAGQAD